MYLLFWLVQVTCLFILNVAQTNVSNFINSITSQRISGNHGEKKNIILVLKFLIAEQFSNIWNIWAIECWTKILPTVF